MRVTILHGLSGAKKAEGTVIIIDVFRASSTIISCLHKKVRNIFPVDTINEARLLKSMHPSWVLIGERNGKKINGFDFGNSPAAVMRSDISNKTVILTTSSGTKGIVHADNAEEVIIVSFSNISKIISYLEKKNPSLVSLVPMGLHARTPAIEDDICAEIISRRLLGKRTEITDPFSVIKNSPGIKRLQRLGQDRDIHYCLEQDIFPIIPVYNKNNHVIIQKE